MFRWKSIWLRWCNLTINIVKDLHKNDKFVLWIVRQGDRFSWIINLVSLLVTAVCPSFWDHNPPGGGDGGHDSNMYETCTNDTWLHEKLVSPDNQRIRNKYEKKTNYSLAANPKILEHQLVAVKRSSLFYAQVRANTECV